MGSKLPVSRCRLTLRLSPEAHDELVEWTNGQDLYFVSAPTFIFGSVKPDSYDVIISCPNEQMKLLVRLTWAGR
jgi:hypothetical protein